MHKLIIPKELESLNLEQYKKIIRTHMRQGIAFELKATPTLIISGYKFSGSLPYNILETISLDFLDDNKLNFDILPKDYPKPEKIPDEKMPQITDKEIIMGYEDAEITIVEFADLQCPPCSNYTLALHKLLMNHKGCFSLIFKHFPWKDIHPLAELAALCVEAAKKKGNEKNLINLIFDLTRKKLLNFKNLITAMKNVKMI